MKSREERAATKAGLKQNAGTDGPLAKGGNWPRSRRRGTRAATAANESESFVGADRRIRVICWRQRIRVIRSRQRIRVIRANAFEPFFGAAARNPSLCAMEPMPAVREAASQATGATRPPARGAHSKEKGRTRSAAAALRALGWVGPPDGRPAGRLEAGRAALAPPVEHRRIAARPCDQENLPRTVDNMIAQPTLPHTRGSTPRVTPLLPQLF